jgi:drug/metabolite transporter (DMT)-like permease
VTGLVVLAFGEAAAGAVGYGAASVVQARTARDVDGLGVVAKPWYVAGLAADLVAWVASVLAMRVLPLFLVQSLLATSLAVTVLLAWPLLGHRPRRRDAVAVAVAVAALTGIAWTAGPEASRPPTVGLVVAAAVALAVGLVWFGSRLRRGGGLEQAVLCGWAFSWLAVCVRAVPVPSVSLPDGWLALLSGLVVEPLAWGVAAFGLLGTLAFARAVQRGRVGAVTVTMWVVEVLVAGGVGVLALGDRVRPGTAWIAAGCVVSALAACVALGSGAGSALDEAAETGGEEALGDQRLAGGVGVVPVAGEQVGDVPVRGRSVEGGVEPDERRAGLLGGVADDLVGLEGQRPGRPEAGR